MLLDIYRQIRNATQYSLDGLGYLMSSEFAARLEVYAFFWVSCLLIYLQAPLSVLVTTFILFCLLIAVEALNTAIEVVVDRVSPEISEMGKQGKDLGSFSVMCLMAANGVNFLYALSQCDWSIAAHTFSTTGGAMLLSGILLYIGVYILARRSPLKPLGIWLTLGLIALYLLSMGVHLAGVVASGHTVRILTFNIFGAEGSGQLIVGGIAYAFISIVVLSFVHDLLSKQKFRLSVICLAFIKRRVNVSNPQGEQAIAHKRQRQVAWRHYLGLPVLVLAVIINPFGQDLFELI